MSDNLDFPQFHEPTGLTFVGSDNSLSLSPTDFEALSTVTYPQDVDQSLIDSWSQDAFPLGSLMDQDGVLGLAMDSGSSDMGGLTEFLLAEPITRMDSQLDDIEAAQFDITFSPLSLLDLPKSSYEVHSELVSVSGSPEPTSTL
ncbi:hypothetical protein FBEOM_731 [Fusarium beomiforme]|uniref:Uncharacterized protein n=1 Tax=Fusarium beomiforme TaxID=44412 RepID=A0A9P5AUX5_9HYPO|nr:hypothetical protein FBEOM_731 [Fusarium beomiforme]